MKSNEYPQHSRWLVLIGFLKLLKALLFILLGFGVLRLLHKDLVDLITRLAVDLRFDPENHFVNVILEKVAFISPHRLKLISAAIFGYALIDIIEGTGLALEKIWAEYLTLVITASFLPWELFEIMRHLTALKIVLFLLNVAVLIYLIFHVQGRMKARAAQEAETPDVMKTSGLS